MITLTFAISCLFSSPLLFTPPPTWSSLFNGDNLEGWTIVNGAQSTWTVNNDMIICSGKPTGVMRTDRMYENFILELDWRHMTEFGNAGLFVWSDPIPSTGCPFTRSVEVQIMVGAVEEKNRKWYTTQGDIFPIWGAVMTPNDPHPMGEQHQRDFPSEQRTNPAPQWNHYVVTCIDGEINLSVNGAFVTGGSGVTPKKGYICLESEGTEIHFKNIRILELPPTGPPTTDVAETDIGFRSLYNGVDLTGWNSSKDETEHWTVNGWQLHHDGTGSELTTSRSFGEYELMIDSRCENPDGEVYLFIDDVKVVLPRNGGKWSRFVTRGKSGTIRIGSTEKADFCNIFIRELMPPSN